MKLKITTLLFLSAITAFAATDNDERGRGDRKPPSPEEFIERLDADGDGKVSQDEFDGPDEHFTKCDSDGDGYITEDEAPSGPPPRGKKDR
ncbi:MULTISPECIES: hypothetical protein [unclassified Lentimonas]|uniref:hypothetical protein n=1 Tax=unclassified Lentimonas TaxID=2630993 RepID=UPI001324418A|nr:MULTISPECIES: hypothetical protein [unclassified Lentimonas]CAA6677265.1 Unannotated [Lentimonas sp. CC4]CAA6686110.1 Unannotated [Lentimonas sp. CC6]CAA6691385.1 Unannotated [Lentimonas sp. CC10]CAA6693125.1 Unannotated [Lentimonas sp. CC19]CAA7068993.1 Unannotated [Lentimonas sp. CC11]